MEPESYFDIVAREPVQGGHSAAVKEKLRVHDPDGDRWVFLKRTSAIEVAALRSAGLVPTASAVPELIHTSKDAYGHWIATPFYPGVPPTAESTIPLDVAQTLAAMHAYYLDAGPPDAIPTITEDWIPSLCAVPRLQQLVQEGRSALAPILEPIRSWSDHPLLIHTLATRPRTLLHGDVHRNNVIMKEGSSQLVDWEGAKYGLPVLDLTTLGGPGNPGHEHYCATWQALTGEDIESHAWQRGYLTAKVCVNVKYISFAARHFGDSEALRMFNEARDALSRLEQLASS